MLLQAYTRLLSIITTARQKEDGVTAIEYGLIASLIAVAIIAAVLAVGGKLTTTFDAIADAL